MDRRAKEFLFGFRRAAQLAQQIRACPPSHTSASEYLEDVAHLHATADDLVRRGLAVGCLCALGKA
jgi:hypothetical protein